METYNKKYKIVAPDGYVEEWSQADFEKGGAALMSDNPDVKVYSQELYDPTQQYGTNVAYGIEDKDGYFESWTADEWSKGKDALLRDHPNLKIYVLGDASQDYHRQKAEEQRQAITDFDAANKDFIRAHELDSLIMSEGGAVGADYDANDKKYNDLLAEREQLVSNYAANPTNKQDWRASAQYADQIASNYESKLKGMRDATRFSNAATSMYSGNIRENNDYVLYEQARKLAKDAAKAYAAPSYGERTGFGGYVKDMGTGAGKVFSDVDFWSRGLSAIDRDKNVRKIVNSLSEKGINVLEASEKELYDNLSPAQLALISSFLLDAQAQYERSLDTARGYNAGVTFADSIGYMAEFLAAGGIARAVGSAGKAASSGFGKLLANELSKGSEAAIKSKVSRGLINTFTKGGTKSLSKGAKAATNIASKAAGKAYSYGIRPVESTIWHTALQPSTYRTISENLTQINDNGELVKAGSAIWGGVLDQLIENWSESMGGAVEDILGLPLKGIGAAGEKILGKTTLGQWGKWLADSASAKVLHEAGFNGLIGEMGEEWLGNAARVGLGLMTKDEFKDFASFESQVDMAASFAPMTLFGLGTSSYAAAKQDKNYRKLAKDMRGVLNRAGWSEEDVAEVMDVKHTKEEIARTLAPVLQSIVRNSQDGKVAQEDYITTLKFAQAAAIQEVLSSAQTIEQERARKDMQEEIAQDLGAVPQEVKDENGTTVIRPGDNRGNFSYTQVAQTPSGNYGVKVVTTAKDAKGEYFVIPDDDSNIMLLKNRNDANAEPRFISRQEFQEQVDAGLMTTETSTLDNYLDARIEEKREMQRKDAENAQLEDKYQQVAQKMQVGSKINAGTEDAPMEGVVLAVDRGGVTVDFGQPVLLNGRNMQIHKLSLEQAGNFVGVDARIESEQRSVEEQVEQDEINSAKVKAYNQSLAGEQFTVDGRLYTYVHMFEMPQLDDDGIEIAHIVATDEQGRDVKMDIPLEDIKTGETDAAVKDNEQVEEVKDDNVLRDIHGNPIPMRVNEKTQQEEVDKRTFKNKDPEAYYAWNDAQRGGNTEDSMQAITADIASETAQLTALQKQLTVETDPDMRDELHESVNKTQNLINLLEGIYHKYDAENNFQDEQLDFARRIYDVQSKLINAKTQEQVDALIKIKADLFRHYQLATVDSAENVMLAKRAVELQQMINSVADVPVQVVFESNIEAVMRTDGASEASINRVLSKVAELRSARITSGKDPVMTGLYNEGKVYIFAEGNTDASSALLTYYHERQHMRTAEDPEAMNKVLVLARNERDNLIQVLSLLTDNIAPYQGANNQELADEIVASAMEKACTDEKYEQTLRSRGLSEELINIIKTEYAKQRRITDSDAVRQEDWNANVRTSDTGNGQQDGAVEQGASGNGQLGTAQLSTDTGISEEEPQVDTTPRDFRGNPLPLEADGTTVDQKTLWDNDPEAWVRWNDDINNDAGADSIAYINAVIEKLNKAIKTNEKAYAKATDFDKRDKLKGQIKEEKQRLDELHAILRAYRQKQSEEASAKMQADAVRAREARKAKAEELAKYNTESLQDIKRKWEDAPKDTGDVDSIVLANGERIEGHYVLTEAFAPTPSHDPVAGYSMTKGFPVDENGNTVNDRDYQYDKEAQRLVEQKASSFDQRALQTPVVVSSDGVVLSGNDRTMASQIAARQGTDNNYNTYLASHPQRFGFTADQISKYSNPRVVFVPDAPMPYTTATFAKFNAEEKKTQSKTESAVKAGKTISPEAVEHIAMIVNEHESIAETYSDKNAVAAILRILIDSGIVQESEISRLMDGDSLSGTGEDLVESVVLGAVMREDALRCAMADKMIRRSVMSALTQLLKNNTYGEYSLSGEFSDAVVLLYQAKRSGLVKPGESVANFMNQPVLDGFGENPLAEVTVQMLANTINGTKVNGLKNVLSLYNARAEMAASGQADLFLGSVEAKEQIIREILNEYGYNTETFTAAAAEQRPGQQSEQQSKQGSSEEQAPDAVSGDAGSGAEEINQVRAIEEQRKVVDTDPTEAQKEAGNYRMGHVRIDGLDITIENPRGSIRKGTDADGHEWQTEMHNDYGYIRGTKAVDDDHIDVFLSDNPTRGKVYVVDQVDPKTGEFDESKVMYGFDSEQDAREAYLSNYEDGWQGLGKITEVSKEEFKKWIDSSTRKTKPFSEYASVKAAEAKKENTTDNQGNPVNEDGTLKVEKIKSVDDLTDEDFSSPTRSVQLPKLPDNIDAAIGANGKPIIIKKNIFERNSTTHHEVSPQQAREILTAALYSPDLYGQNQKATRPYNWIVINTKDNEGQNKLVVLEVNDNKDNVEIVHWYVVDNRGVEKVKRQAAREGGHILILPSEMEEAGALSGRPSDLSSDGKDTQSSETKQVSKGESGAPKIKKVNPFDFVDKDKYTQRPIFKGVYHDKGMLVATDTAVLVAIKDNYPEELERAVTFKDGHVTADVKFPDWRSVFTDTGKQTKVDITLDKLASYLEQIKANVPKKILTDEDRRASFVVIDFGDGNSSAYNYERLVKFVNAARFLNAQVSYCSAAGKLRNLPDKKLIAEGANGMVALFPVKFGEDHKFNYNVPLNEAEDSRFRIVESTDEEILSDSNQKDSEYFAAIERGDMEEAQRIVNEFAQKAGYTTISDYQGTSAFNGATPYGNPYFFTKEERKDAWDNDEFEGDQTLGDYIERGIDAHNLDFLALDPRNYRAANSMRKEAIDNVRNAIQKRSKTITMFRSVPSEIKEGSFRNGDWVTPSRAYAVDNAKIHGWGDNYNIIKQTVSVDEIWWDGNDIAEWGYGREEDYVNDTDFAYKNTKNNRKLLDVITRDDDGNIIPPSKRFDSGKADERYQISGRKAIDEKSEESRIAYEAVKEQLDRIGIPVELLSGQAMREMAINTNALETVSSQDEYQQTVVSSASGAKVINNLDNLAKSLENEPKTKEKTFLGALAKALDAKKHGSNSQYATFEAKNGTVVTIRLANHNVATSTFDNHGENDGISIVVSARENNGITNDGKAHVTEFYYDAIKLRKAEGKPLVDIVKSVKQSLYSGEYKDTTGLAQREEVNAKDVPEFMTVYHGSGAKFDKFDHSHMGEGEGAQAFGWGTYVTEVEGIGRTYAKAAAAKDNGALTKRNLYTVEIPKDINSALSRDEILKGLDSIGKELFSGYGLNDVQINAVFGTTREWYKYGNTATSDYFPLKEAFKAYGIDAETIDKRIHDEAKEDRRKNPAGYGFYLNWVGRIDMWIEKLGISEDEYERYDMATGRDAYRYLEIKLGGAKEASDYLSDHGYVGISYPAQYMSGGRSDGARNYVIFNENNAKIVDRIEFLREPDGTVYGATVGGKIYLNRERLNPNTPIHEYTHLWFSALEKANPELYKRGVELMRQLPIWEEVKTDPNYAELSGDDAIASECLSRLVGDKGADVLTKMAKDANVRGDIIGTANRISLIEKFKDWLKKFWTWVRDSFTPWTKEEAARVSVNDIQNMVLSDLAKGVNPRKMDKDEDGVRFSARQKRALETASLGNNPRSLTVVSSATGAKILNSIDKLVESLEKSATQPKTFIGDVAKALGASRFGSGSEYATFEAMNGDVVTIRLANHNAHVSGFDHNGKDNGISIVISPKPNEGLINDGDAHIVEFYYDSIKLRRADGKPLAEIVRSIKQALYSGEFKDTTGLAERQEVNGDDFEDLIKRNPGSFDAPENGIRFRIVTEPKLIEQLNLEPTVKVFRAMQIVDGELFPPMSITVNGKKREPSKIGQWEQSEENPELADENGYFKLNKGKNDKGENKSLKAKYNPYFHTSLFPLNDQFSEAQTRSNIVIVEGSVPKSELTSGYRAEKAKDSVGKMTWHSGPVAGILGQYKGKEREVILSRWFKPERIVPYDQIADISVQMFKGTSLEKNPLPSNVFHPDLRNELEKRGVSFVETNNRGQLLDDAEGRTWSSLYGKEAAGKKVVKTLAGVHNITEEKLRKALKLGGFANPSLAVIDTEKSNHENFGEISLIAPSALVNKESGRTAGTWTTDAYTQRYPSVERQMSDKGYEEFSKWVDGLDFTDSEKAEIKRQTTDALEDNREPAWELMYLKEKGIDIKAYSSDVSYGWEPVVETYGSVDDVLNAMEGDAELDEKIRNLVKVEIASPLMSTIRNTIRLQIYEETGKVPSSSNLAVTKRAHEIFDKEYAPKLFDENGQVKSEDVRKVVGEMLAKYNDTKRFNFQKAKARASTYVHNNGMYMDYLRWQEEKLEDYGTKGRIFRGYNSDGTRRYSQETLENVSKAMSENAEGETNGSESTSFGSFIAKLAPHVDSTEEMRSRKDKLSSAEDEKKEFYDKWEDTYYALAKELYDDVYYGEKRLHEIVLQQDPKRYAKKEYGITLSASFMKNLEALKKAIREDLKSPYFETKFERPVGLNEFAAAVVPDDLGADVRKMLDESGIALYEYDPAKEGDRSRAFNEALEGNDKIRFRIVGGNSGYVGYSMSKRAAEAKEEGRFPKTQFVKEYGVPATHLDALVAAGIISNDEWHHTSKFGNKTPFYGWVEDNFLQAYNDNKAAIEEIIKQYNGTDPLSFTERRKLAEKIAAIIESSESVVSAREPAEALIAQREAEKAHRRDVMSEMANSEGKIKKSGNEYWYNADNQVSLHMHDNGRIIDIEFPIGTKTQSQRDELYKAAQEEFREAYERAEKILQDKANENSEEQKLAPDVESSESRFTVVKSYDGLQSFGQDKLFDIMHKTFADLPESTRAKITKLAPAHRYKFHEATADYFASLATKKDLSEEEKMDVMVVRDNIKAALDIDYLSFSETLWVLYNTVNKNSKGFLSIARRTLAADELGFMPEDRSKRDDVKDGVRFSIKKNSHGASAAEIYNKATSYWYNRLRESYVDMNESVNDLVAAIESTTKQPAQAFEDVRLALNRQSSKGLNQMTKFMSDYLEPMWGAVGKVMEATGMTYDEVVRYVMLKHAVERNDVFARRDARRFYERKYDSIISKLKDEKKQKENMRKRAMANAEISIAYALDQEIQNIDKQIDSALKSLDSQLVKVDNGTSTKYKELREQDYGGLTSMYSKYPGLGARSDYATDEEYNKAARKVRVPMYDNVSDMENAARSEVNAFEKRTSGDEFNELWRRINAATKKTLESQYDNNIISKEQYKAARDQFKYYVPLRGFKDTKAEDIWTYMDVSLSGSFAPALKNAKGRKSEAENPFNWIGTMASSAIAQNVKNEAKLALYYFIANRPNQDLVTIGKVWYQYDAAATAAHAAANPGDTKKIFTPVYPPITTGLDSNAAKDAYDTWEADMKAKAAAGEAYQRTNKLNVQDDVAFISDKQMPQHVIKLKVRGEEVNLYINGDPRAAQAINGMLNVETNSGYQKVFGPILRWMSAVNTSYNPEFWISNLQRDFMFALMSSSITGEGANNLLKGFVNPKKIMQMMRDYEAGKLGNSREENYYREFAEGGGITGFTVIVGNEVWEKKIQEYLSPSDFSKISKSIKFDKFLKFFNDLGEAVEQMSRFAAFISARETGKSIEEAVAASKEITVNFNRKGSGKIVDWADLDKLTTADGAKLNKAQKLAVFTASFIPAYGRRFVMFFNAAVQGMNAMYKLWKKDHRKTLAWASGYFAIGVLQAVLHALADDDDDYLDIPDYTRRNNLLLGGGGIYFKWALPQEMRPFYALGDIFVNQIMGREPNKNMLLEMANSTADILPLGPENVLPSVIQPSWDLYTNKDFTGSKIYNDNKYLSEAEREARPNYKDPRPQTNKLFIDISQVLNALSGGDEYSAGAVNVHPESMQHVVESLGGGLLTTMNKAEETVAGILGAIIGEDMIDQDLSVRRFPFLNRVLMVNDERTRNSHVSDLYYYYKDMSDVVEDKMRRMKKEMNYDALEKLQNSPEYEVYQIVKSYKKMMQRYDDDLKAEEDRNERKSIMREQDELRKEMINEISQTR